MADFAELRSIKDYREVIADKLNDLDVAILVLNAGYIIGGPFSELTDTEVEKHIQVNANHVVYLAKSMLCQLSSRFESQNKKSALIMVSSNLSQVALPFISCYCATKTFSSYLAEALRAENIKKVDIIAYEAG